MKVLIVDDTKNIRMLLLRCLEMEGYDVQTAGDGKTALELFTKERFDLAFLDIKMPHFSGTEVLKRIREMGIRTPVIIITAYATVKNAVECTNLGSVAYLQKPFSAEKIKSVLNEILKFNSGESSLENILNLARSEVESGRAEKAEKILRRAVSDYTLSPEVYQLLSRVCEVRQNRKDALKYRKIFEALTPAADTDGE